MPPAVAIGVVAVGAAVGGYFSYKGAQAQADASRDAARMNADAMRVAARSEANSLAKIRAQDAKLQGDLMKQERYAFLATAEQNKKNMINTELQFLGEKATTNTFHRLMGGITNWIGSTFQIQQAEAIDQRGVADRVNPDPVAPNAYDAMTRDSLTGNETHRDNYQFTSEILDEAEQMIESTSNRGRRA